MNCPGPSEDSSLVFLHCSQVHSNSLKRYSKAVGMMGHQIIIDPHFHESGSEVAQSCPTLWDPVDCSLPGSSIHGILQAKILERVAISFSNTGVGCHFLLQGIFLTQGSNPGVLHCRQILYHSSHQGSPAPMLIALLFTRAKRLSNTSVYQ